MKEREKYIIVISGEAIEVTPEVYEVYYRAERKERHFMYELKAGRSRVDKVTGEKIFLPSLEDSYDRLVEASMQFDDCIYDLEEEVLSILMVERLNQAIATLSFEEAEIIRQLYYEEVSEMKLAERLGMPRRTLRDKKKRILEKLRKMLL
ncbi:MAG: sigma-70 family RNA polymerase sigma factor [Lachnospiraceae bacterium]|nr:sigma-70 family RNA polymerase sigma factor [Lachnospiraceae bacterium]